MNRADIFSSTARPPTQGTLAQVREYWTETWPNAMDARMQPRRTTAEELYPHLALERTPSRSAPTVTRTSTTGAAPARTHSPVRAVGSRSSLSMSASGSFFSAAEAQRAHVSPLGGKVW
jgi:hypothetical protein